jgi:hypothetical protein
MKPILAFAIIAFAVWAENYCGFDIEQILKLTIP